MHPQIQPSCLCMGSLPSCPHISGLCSPALVLCWGWQHRWGPGIPPLAPGCWRSRDGGWRLKPSFGKAGGGWAGTGGGGVTGEGAGSQPDLTGSLFSLLAWQKLAFYSKMQEAPESTSSASTSSASSSFSSHAPPASIKEEDASPEKEQPPEAEYINSRCVLFTYFQGDISAVVDEHFSRALSQPSSYSPSSTKASRSSSSWRGEHLELLPARPLV